MEILNNCLGFSSYKSFKDIKNSIDNFWIIAKEIRHDLGENGYFLDEYLDIIFKILENMDAFNIKDIGDKVYENIHNDVCIIKCQRNSKKSIYFSMVEDYINKNPVSYIRPTLLQYYIVNIIMENIDMICNKLISDIQKNLYADLDFVMGEEMLGKMSKIVGNEKIEKLNKYIYSSFLICPIFNALLLQLFSLCSGMLLYRDRQSSKRIHRILTE